MSVRPGQPVGRGPDVIQAGWLSPATSDGDSEIFRGWFPAVLPPLDAGSDTSEADTHRRFLRGCIFGRGCESPRLQPSLARNVSELRLASQPSRASTQRALFHACRWRARSGERRLSTIAARHPFGPRRWTRRALNELRWQTNLREPRLSERFFTLAAGELASGERRLSTVRQQRTVWLRPAEQPQLTAMVLRNRSCRPQQASVSDTSS